MAAVYLRAAAPPSNPRRFPQRLVHAGLPAGALGAEGGDDVLVEAERGLVLGRLVHARPAGTSWVQSFRGDDEGERSGVPGQARDDEGGRSGVHERGPLCSPRDCTPVHQARDDGGGGRRVIAPRSVARPPPTGQKVLASAHRAIAARHDW